MRRIIPVWQVNRYVNQLIDSDYSLNDLWIEGEVSNCKYYPSGIYFTIKDSRASLKAVMFTREAENLSFRMQEGMKLYARVRLELYEKMGTYQAIVMDVEKQGKGILYEKFEQLKENLAQEGLFDESLKKPIPLFAKRVGIITSKSGAAVHDIIKVAKHRHSGIPLILYPVHVQGDHAVPDIVEALEIANHENCVDVIILGRGGGSIEDLWAFNEEAVARAIVHSKIPVVSAVGHEVDFTIADFVSDKRAATPSAAAELVIPSKQEWHNVLSSKEKRLESLLNQKFDKAKTELERKETTLKMYYERNMARYQKRYELALHNLERLSPLNTLKRGYSFVSLEDGKVIKSAEDVALESTIHIVLAEGKLKAVVKEKEE